VPFLAFDLKSGPGRAQIYTRAPFAPRTSVSTVESVPDAHPRAVSPPVGAAADPRWHQPHYVVKERRFTLGRQYRVLDATGQLVAFCKQKMFRLREDVRFYADESQHHELFRLQTQKIIDFNANFVVTESGSERPLGILRRKGWKSLLRDEWHVLDALERPVAVLKEDSGFLALVRRFLISWIPYRYDLHRDGAQSGPRLGTIKERFQLFGDTYDLTIEPDAGIDARLLLGLAVCVDAMEGE